MAIIGLLLISLGWALQLLTLQTKPNLNRMFVLSYAAGVTFLVLDNVLTQMNILAMLNILTLLIVFVVITYLKK